MFAMLQASTTVLQQGFHLSQHQSALHRRKFVPKCTAKFPDPCRKKKSSHPHPIQKKKNTIPIPHPPSPSHLHPPSPSPPSPPSPPVPHLVDAATALHRQNGLHLVAPRLQHLGAGLRNSLHLLELAVLHLAAGGVPLQNLWEKMMGTNMGKLKDFEQPKVTVTVEFMVKTPTKASDGRDELRMGMVGNYIFGGKSTRSAGNQDFVWWKTRTSRLWDKSRGMIISGRSSLDIDLQLSSGSQNWIDSRLIPNNLTNIFLPFLAAPPVPLRKQCTL